MNEKMSFKMGVTFAASFYMGKNFLYGRYLYDKVPEVNYIECESKLDQEKVWDEQCHP